MNSPSRITTLRSLNKYFMNNANDHLNEACKKLQQHPPAYRSHNETQAQNLNRNMYSNSIHNYFTNVAKRNQYDNWQSRNASQQVAANFNWNTKSDNRTHSNRLQSSSAIPASKDVNPNKKFRRLLVSGKNYKKSEPTIDQDNSKPYAPCKNCYCHNANDLKILNCTCHYSNNHIYDKTRYNSKEKFEYSTKPYNNSYNGSERSTSDSTYSDYSGVEDVADDLLCKFDTDDLEDVKKFRDKHYFECHSMNAKLNEQRPDFPKPHKCKHDFYINDRLFPEPEYADHQNVSRCRECHLPLNMERDHSNATRSQKLHLCKLSKMDGFAVASNVRRSSYNDQYSANDSSYESDYVRSSSSSNSFDARSGIINEGSSCATRKSNSVKTDNLPEVHIKIPLKSDLLIPQFKKSSRTDLHKGKNAKTNLSRFENVRKPPEIGDSLALRYQRGFRNLSNDS